MNVPSAVATGLAGSRARSKMATLAVRSGFPTGAFDAASTNEKSSRFGPHVNSAFELIRTGTTDGFVVAGPQPVGVPGSAAAGQPVEPDAVAAPGVRDGDGVDDPHAPTSTAIATTATIRKGERMTQAYPWTLVSAFRGSARPGGRIRGVPDAFPRPPVEAAQEVA
jgi:hypothetical protein